MYGVAYALKIECVGPRVSSTPSLNRMKNTSASVVQPISALEYAGKTYPCSAACCLRVKAEERPSAPPGLVLNVPLEPAKVPRRYEDDDEDGWTTVGIKERMSQYGLLNRYGQPRSA